MRVMGLDVGDKRIGVAMSDALLLTAQLRPTIARDKLDSDLRRLGKIALEDEVHEIVVGQPLHEDGSESGQSRKTARFARALSKALNLPVVFWDERGTSIAAEEHLEQMGLKWRKRRAHIDKIAAAFILQSYLDSKRQ